MRRIGLWSAVLLGACASGIALDATAQSGATSYPSRPIRFVVGYPPGGATDLIARALAVKLSEALAQQVLVDNRPGAGGIVGTEIVAKAAPDGHTIILVTTSHGVNPSL